MKIVERENELYEVRDIAPGEVFIAQVPGYVGKTAYFLSVDLHGNYEFDEKDYNFCFGVNLETGELFCFDAYKLVKAYPEATIYFE